MKDKDREKEREKNTRFPTKIPVYKKEKKRSNEKKVYQTSEMFPKRFTRLPSTFYPVSETGFNNLCGSKGTSFRKMALQFFHGQLQ